MPLKDIYLLGSMLLLRIWQKVSQKALKRREPQRHEDTKFFWACLSCVDKQKKLPLCLRVFVVQGFYAFCDSLDRRCQGIICSMGTLFPPVKVELEV